MADSLDPSHVSHVHIAHLGKAAKKIRPVVWVYTCMCELKTHQEFTLYSYASMQHPGGEDVLLENAGRDATVPFMEVGHSKDAQSILKQYEIGMLVQVRPRASSCNSKTACRAFLPRALQEKFI